MSLTNITNVSPNPLLMPSEFGGAVLFQGSTLQVDAAVGTVYATFRARGYDLTAVQVQSYVPTTQIGPSATFYVDPANGSDGNTGLDPTAPLATIGAAVAATNAVKGAPRIWLAAGTHTLPASAVLQSDERAGVGNEPPCIEGPMEDSGLGERTGAVGGANGSGSTYGTIVDSVGGLTVGAWAGWTLRITADSNNAANVGRAFTIDTNSASTFTVCGGTTGGPYTTNAKFVIERPAAVVRSADNNIELRGLWVARNVRFESSAANNGTLTIREGCLFYQGCWFVNFATFSLDNHGRLVFRTAAGLSSYLLTTYFAGGWFNSSGTMTLRTTRLGLVDLLRALFTNTPCDHGATFGGLMVSCSLRGSSNQRIWGNSQMQYGSCRSTGVTAAVGTAANGAFVFDHGGTGQMVTCDVSSSTAHAVVAATRGALTFLQNCTGTGNSGYGFFTRFGGGANKISGNTIAGTSGELKVGNAAGTTWAVVQGAGAITSDLAAAPSELCWVAP